MVEGMLSPRLRSAAFIAVCMPLVLVVTAGAATPKAASSKAAVVWLCRPGVSPDPCTPSLDAQVVTSSGATAVQTAADATSPVDCFYVYPTVSTESGANADLTVQPPEIAAATAQAGPFSQACRVWAPMYRQRTKSSLAKGLGADPRADTVAFQSVQRAFLDYLANDNGGRPIVFLGHSQGAAMLIRLLRADVDRVQSTRRLLVAAIILGGNVEVPKGEDVGGTFANIPACVSNTRTGCVIAYSTFPGAPPADSLFGIPGQGVSLQSGRTSAAGQQVLCVNPASLSGGSAALVSWFPSPGRTLPWRIYPDLYQAQCRTQGDADWLQITTTKSSGDTRPVVSETLGPRWGYHLDDVNLATGNLVADVEAEAAAFTTARAAR